MWSIKTAPSSPLEIQNGEPTLEDSMEFLIDLNILFIIGPRSYVSYYLINIIENLRSQNRSACECLWSFIYNCPNLEATKMLFSK